MEAMSQPNLHAVDWSTLPQPEDDGAAAHLTGVAWPPLALPTTDSAIDLSGAPGRTVLYIYPMTGRPGVALPDGWDQIPGARGCTPQSCAFRDHHGELLAAGADRIFGLSTQSTDEQREVAARLHLPFALISDDRLRLTKDLRLPTFEVDGRTLLKRMTLVIDDARITKVFYPVFPPDRNPADVLDWLGSNKR
jgi:peroxiredoxin